MNFMTAEVEIKVDDRGLPAQLAKAKQAVTRTVAKIENSFHKMAASFRVAFSKMVRYAKWGSLAIAGAFALVTKRAMKQEDVIKRLEITLKATGHAAGFTRDQLLEQATALQSVTRFGDDTITAMQTMLLTFKQIKGDEFKRATEAALDMATAEAAVSGRAIDLTSTSIRLGKALNDPILGLTALSRVGVQFTEKQKGMIKEMVMTGRVAEAQGIILDELESQFGGMARDVDTASGALKQMWNALGDVAEKIGNAFLPGIRDTAKEIKEWAERNQDRIGRFAETFAAYLSYLKDVIWAFVTFMRTDWKAGIEAGLNITLELFKGFGKSLVVVLRSLGQQASHAFLSAFGTELGAKLMEISEKLPWYGAPVTKQILGRAGAGIFESAVKTPKDIKMETTTEELKKVWEETSRAIKNTVPPELEAKFDKPLLKLKGRLKEIEGVSKQTSKAMEYSLVDTTERTTKAMDDALGKLKTWLSDAKNIWDGLADSAVSALDRTADALTNLVVKGKADFNALAESILMDITRVMVKQTMSQAIGGIGGAFGGGFGSMIGSMFTGGAGVPTAQHGGEVLKTGLAVVHKGEKYSGVDKNYPIGGGQPVTVNLNVSNIDAAGTYEFLAKNKRAIAAMMQGALTSNHPFRKAIKKG
jgi:phage-related minor tail protein